MVSKNPPPAGTAAADDSLFDLAHEYSKLAHDELTSDDVLDHIPLTQSVTTVARFVSNIRDRLLMSKLEHYLTALAETPGEERRAMVERLEAEATYTQKVGEHVIEILDRVDSERKPAMIAYVFAAYAAGEIDLTGFHRLNEAITRLPLVEIDAVRHTVHALSLGLDVDPESVLALGNAGLVVLIVGRDRVSHQATKTCEAFLQLELDVRTSE